MTTPCDQAEIDAGCCQDNGAPTNLPGTTPLPFPNVTAMTACRAAPFVQKRIA